MNTINVIQQLAGRAKNAETRAARETLTTIEDIKAAIDVARELATENHAAAARLSDWIDEDAREISEEADDLAHAFGLELARR